jgi:nitroreductase
MNDVTPAATVLDAIAGRRSVKAALLGAPAPDDAELERLIQTAMSAPDHGALRPWRFRVIRDDDRDALSDLFETALRRRQPDAPQEEIDKIRSKPKRAPLILAIGAEVTENHPKVPPDEQLVAAACATQNLLLAAHARGWGAVLLTGWPAFDPTVQEGLGFDPAKDRMVGFVYMGTPTEAPRPMTRPDAAQFIERWPG